MYAPELYEAEQTRDIIQTFGGYNHNVRIGDGEFYDMKNLSSGNYPALSPRRKRGIVRAVSECNGLTAKNELAYIDGSVLYYGDKSVELDGGVSGERQMISMGAYLLVFPDMIYLNTANLSDYGSIYGREQSFEGAASFRLVDSEGNDIELRSLILDTLIGDGQNDFWAKSFSADDGAYIYINPYDYNNYQDLSGIPAPVTVTINSADSVVYTREKVCNESLKYSVIIGTASYQVDPLIFSDDDGGFNEVNPRLSVKVRSKEASDVLIQAASDWFSSGEKGPCTVATITVTRTYQGKTEERIYNIAIRSDYEYSYLPIKIGDVRLKEYGGIFHTEACIRTCADALDTWNERGCWQEIPSYIRLKMTGSRIGTALRKIIEEKTSEILSLTSVSVSGYSDYSFRSLLGDWSANKFMILKDNAKYFSEDTVDIVGCLGLVAEGKTAGTSISFIPIQKKLDFIIESNNRLWGCRYGKDVSGKFVNEIYATAQGSFKCWDVFEGTSQDSYAVSLGSDGRFTGAVNYRGYPTFFKEKCCHIVYGSYPENYQIVTDTSIGLQEGSHKSLCIIQNVLYYKTGDGVYCYDGSSSYKISEPLGNVSYTGAVGGSSDGKYYISMTDDSALRTLFVYDISRGMWYKEDDIDARFMAQYKDDLYIYDAGSQSLLTAKGTAGNEEENGVPWYADTGIIGYSTPDAKYISRLQLRLSLPAGSRVNFYIEYDSDGYNEFFGGIEGKSFKAFSLPIFPRRCDHFRLRIEGVGECKIFSISKITEEGGDP